MARIRTVKPEFWKHEDLSALPPETHMLAAALLNYADDEGYFNANPKLIQAECCPLREDSTSVPRSITELSKIGYIRLFPGSDGKQYGHVVTFLTHQRVDRPKPSTIKDLEESSKDRRKIDDDAPPEGKGREGKGTGKGKKAPAQKNPLDFSSWPQIPSETILADWLAFKKAKRAPITQTVIEQMGKELRLAVNHGFTVDQCLSVQQEAAWQGYKFDWHLKRESGNANGNGYFGAKRVSAGDEAFNEFIASRTAQADDSIHAEYSEVDETFASDGRQIVPSLGVGPVGSH